MAVANCSSSAMVKAVLLPLILVLLAVSAGASSAEDGPAVAKSGVLFSETPVGRKLLNLELCGSGSAPDFDCKKILGPVGASNATCCTDSFGNQACWDVAGSWVDKCGSCTNKCKVLESCCNGVCVDLSTDKNNCGACGKKCALGCKLSICGY